MGLFSKKSKDSGDSNPYAAQGQDPYANPITPYQQARATVAQGPRSGGGLPTNPRGSSGASINPPPPPYQSPSAASSNSRFGDEKFGSQKGYGSNRYEEKAYQSGGDTQRGGSGYGGFDEGAQQNELFGGAASRYVPPQQGSANGPAPGMNGPAPPGRYGNDPNKSNLFGNAQDRYNPYPQPNSQPGAADDEYGGYGAPRELTEEEKEDQEVQNIKDETNAIRKEGVDSTARSLALSRQAIETATGSFARLGMQGERLHNTERNLDTAAAKSRIAEDKTKELKTLNRSMFAVHMGNPFTAKRRQQDMDNSVIDRHRMERETRESTRKDQFHAGQNMEQTFKEIDRPRGQRLLGADRKAERSKYTFEDDDGTADAMEDEIDENLDELGQNVGILNTIAHKMGEETRRQNTHLDKIAEKSDAVDDHVRMNREKLSRIH